MKKLIAVVLSVVMVLLLASCGEEKKVTLTYNEENELVGDNGEVYKYAPVGYEPTSQGDEFGVIDSVRTQKVYKITDVDPADWITTEYSGATTRVYYDSKIDLPTLFELEPELCYICEENEAVFAVYTLGDPENKRIDAEVADINAIIDLLADESVEPELWPRMGYEESYSLKLYSEKWPAIYYCLDFVKDASGSYVYDPVSKKCINIGDILDGYLGISE